MNKLLQSNLFILLTICVSLLIMKGVLQKTVQTGIDDIRSNSVSREEVHQIIETSLSAHLSQCEIIEE